MSKNLILIRQCMIFERFLLFSKLKSFAKNKSLSYQNFLNHSPHSVFLHHSTSKFSPRTYKVQFKTEGEKKFVLPLGQNLHTF